MKFIFNEIPAINEENLNQMQSLRSQIMTILEKYEIISNQIRLTKNGKSDEKVKGLKRNQTYLENELESLFSESLLADIKSETSELDRKGQRFLFRFGGEHIYPLWMSGNGDNVLYRIRIEYFDPVKIHEKNKGYEKAGKFISVFSVDYLNNNLENILFSDKHIERDFDRYALTILHKIYAIEDSVFQSNQNGKKMNYDRLLEDYKLRYDTRKKGGPQRFIKRAKWLFGETPSNVDDNGIRLICPEVDFQRKVTEIYQHLNDSKMYQGRGRVGTLIIHSLIPDLDYAKKEFLDFVGEHNKKIRNDYDRIISVEDRSEKLGKNMGVEMNGKTKKISMNGSTADNLLPYYAEILAPIDDVGNVVDILLYPLVCFETMYKSGNDQTSYRVEEIEKFRNSLNKPKITILNKLAPSFVQGSDLKYMTNLVGSRTY
jgi:hypothetical protein